LPPQPLDPRFTKKRVKEFVRRFPKTPLKTLLLDQRGFPGIGNWMADEICWQLRLPPQTLSGSLDETKLDDVWKETRRVSREAMRVIGSDWGDLSDAWLMNHRWRDGGICPRRGCRTGAGARGSPWTHDLLVSEMPGLMVTGHGSRVTGRKSEVGSRKSEVGSRNTRSG
jgi:formamidopyrimidine-DNA glycosylase